MTQLTLGMGGHQSASARSIEWLTPPDILARLGPFELDPCAPVIRPWPTAEHHYTIEDDGLSKPWFGRVWLNPPYGDATARWLARLVSHGTGTALIFARTETEAFFRWVWDEATACLFLRGRLHFHRVDGTRARANAGAPSVLVAYGHDDADRLAAGEIDGQFVPLRLPVVIAVALGGAGQSWRQVVRSAVERSGGTVRLADLYMLLRGHPKTRANRHWRAKVRQTLQRGQFKPLGGGFWSVSH